MADEAPIQPDPMSDTPDTPTNGVVSPDSEQSKGDYLTDIELDLVFFVERYHSTVGESPTDAKIKERYDVNDATLEAFKTNPLVIRSMEARGIPYPNAEDKFTARQMAAAAAMLAYTDRRSDQKKLSDIGVSSREWAGWLQDESFAHYLRDRSERMATNSLHEAHLGIMKGVRNGNTASIKLYLEMQNRYNPEAANQIDIQSVLHRFIEAIQKHVKDPITLHRIATELSNIAAANSYGTAIAGNVVRTQSYEPSPFGAINGRD